MANMLGNQNPRRGSGCDCPDCSVPKKTQRVRETKQWMQDYLEEVEEDDNEHA